MHKNYEISPIAIFVYNRLAVLKKTINYLSKNYLSKQTTLYIFSDGPKNLTGDQKKVYEVRKYLKKIKSFKNVIIFENKKNIGLGSSVINGVNFVLRKHSKIIVLEDDLITNKFFLKYMNDCLKYLKKNKSVFHINGSNHNLKKYTEKFDDYFLFRVPFSWGWATWRDRWKYFSNKNENLILKLKNSKQFDFNNSHFFYPQLIANYRKKINTWAIFWYSSIFLKNKLCFTPKDSFIMNIGYGLNATHTKNFNTKFNINLKDLNRKYSSIHLRKYIHIKSENLEYIPFYKRYLLANNQKNIKSILVVNFYKIFVYIKSIVYNK